MMTRRNFVKALTSGSLLALNSNLIFSNDRRSEYLNVIQDSVYHKPYNKHIWKEVDLVVIGGTTGGISTAISAAKKGLKVFVVTSYPYLGEDICAFFRFWPKSYEKSSDLFKKIFISKIPPTPLHVKTVLESELINNDIEFVYCSFISNILIDSSGNLSGICINNRSGQQVIKSKCIVDTTQEAIVAKLSNATFHDFSPQRCKFNFVVVGNKEKKHTSIINTNVIYPAFNVNGKSFQAIEYTYEIFLENYDYDSIMKIEHDIRTITWDIEQVDSSDSLFFVPCSYLKSKDRFQTDEYYNLFVFGLNSSIPRNKIMDFMEPNKYIEEGEILGNRIFELVKNIRVGKGCIIKPILPLGDIVGEILLVNNSRFLPPLDLAEFRGGGIPVLGSYDVVVVGGGTAGAPAAISVARKGVKVLLLEYLHGLGGIGTFGLIGRYTAGYCKGFTEEIDLAMQNIAPKGHSRKIREDSREWPIDWKAEWYRKEILKSGGVIWNQVLVNGVIKDGDKINGVVVHTPMGEGIIYCKCVIDSTGSADVAIAAGCDYEYTSSESLAVQGAGLGHYNLGDHYNNTDWTFVDDTDVIDVTRLFIQAKLKNIGSYDIGKLPQTRERRRIIAEYNISVTDMINEKTFYDTISYHRSNFDTHGFTEDVFFTINPPEGGHRTYDVRLPLRSLLPHRLENILVTGLGCGANRDAMPVIRMQPDLQNQGYAVGIVAAESILQSKSICKLDIKSIQRQLVDKGNLPIEVLKENDSPLITKQEIECLKDVVIDNYKGLEKILSVPDISIPILKQWYRNGSFTDKLYYANILCMMREPIGFERILEEVKLYVNWDKGWNYRGMHQFGYSSSRLDNYVIALGYSNNSIVIPEILRLLKLLTPESEFSHFRAISIAIENCISKEFQHILYNLLISGMKGNYIRTQKESTIKIKPNIIDRVYILEDTMRNKALKELYLSKALYLCGDKDGLGKKVLENYALGQEGHYARFASEVLQKVVKH